MLRRSVQIAYGKAHFYAEAGIFFFEILVLFAGKSFKGGNVNATSIILKNSSCVGKTAVFGSLQSENGGFFSSHRNIGNSAINFGPNWTFEFSGIRWFRRRMIAFINLPIADSPIHSFGKF